MRRPIRALGKTVYSNIHSQMATPGQRLLEVRQRGGLTVEQVSAETRISAGIIRALEADDYGGFDSAIYAKSFLNTYSKFLGLNFSGVLVKFDEVTPNSQTFFKRNRLQLENTARPEVVQRSRSPLFLAPVLVGILAFLCYSLFMLFTGGALPFAPSDKPAKEPGPAAAQGAAKADLAGPVEEGGMAAEGGGAGDLHDPHASSGTIFLPTSDSAEHQVLP